MSEARRISLAALLLLPAAATVYFAFNSGGFYPGPPAYAALLLCLILLLRATLAERPFAGLSPWLALGCGALGAYTLMTLLSAVWSHAPGRAIAEFDLPLI